MENNDVIIRPYEAVRTNLLTIQEFESWIRYMETDLEELFWALKNFDKDKLIERLRKTKLEYESRFFDKNINDQNSFRHIYNKVHIFIDIEIDKLQFELAELRGRLVDSDTQSNNTKKLFWNGKLNELVWVFHQLKNKQTSKKDAKGNYVKYLSCNNEELIDFIFNNFELNAMTKGTLKKYIENPKSQKKIVFSDQ